MKLCYNPNDTIASISTNLKHIIAVEDERYIVGCIGGCIDRILAPMKERKCRIVGVEGLLGDRLPNGSYTGVFGMLQRKKIGFYLKGEPISLVSEGWLKRSLPVKTDNVMFAQEIYEKEDIMFDMSSNLNFGPEFIVCYCVSLGFIWLFCVFLNKLILKRDGTSQSSATGLRPKRKEQFLDLFLRKDVSEKVRIILPFFSMFFWMTILFILNNIKTNKVIVDTSDLAKDAFDLLNTDKVLCWTKQNTEVNLALSLPKSAILSRLYHEKSNFLESQKEERRVLSSDKCLLGRDLNLLESPLFKNRKNLMLVLSRQEANPYLIVLSQMNIFKQIWALTHGIQEFNLVFYYTSVHEQRIEEAFNYQNIETGLVSQIYACMDRNTEMMVRKGMKVYRDLGEYIDDNTAFDSLVLSNFRSIFSVYFSLMLLYFVCFVVQKFAKKRTFKRLRHLFRRAWKRLFKRKNQVHATDIVVVGETIELT